MCRRLAQILFPSSSRNKWTYSVPIQKESKASNKHDNPLKALSVNSLINLPHANISIL